MNSNGSISFIEFKKLFKRFWSSVVQVDYDERPAPHDWRCAMAALLVQDFFGGEILQGMVVLPSGEKVSHVWNILEEGVILDMTQDQFEPGSLIPLGKAFSREKILSKDIPNERYKALKFSFEVYYKAEQN